MGFFSFLTCDTQESVMNRYTDECKPVYLLQPNGKPPIEDNAYDGYGRFGGVDYIEWLRENNSNGFDELADEENEFPIKLSFNKDAVYEDYPGSKNCPRQGFFAPMKKRKTVEALCQT